MIKNRNRKIIKEKKWNKKIGKNIYILEKENILVNHQIVLKILVLVQVQVISVQVIVQVQAIIINIEKK